MTIKSCLEVYVPSVTSRTHGEVYPDSRASLLQDQFVEVLLLAVRDVQQDAGIAYRLLLTRTVDIYRAARQMVRVRRTSTELIRIR
jgi:hypothetical protein